MPINIIRNLNVLDSQDRRYTVSHKGIDDTERLRQLENDLDRIQIWVRNCDQKSSILLATIGVLFGLVFSTESISKLKRMCHIFYSSNEHGCWQIIGFIVLLILFILTLLSVILTISYLLMAIKSRTDPTKIIKGYRQNKSKTFFRDISSISFDTFKNERISSTNEERIEELISQLYINSRICSIKFDKYNMGLIFFFIALTLICIDLIILYLA